MKNGGGEAVASALPHLHLSSLPVSTSAKEGGRQGQHPTMLHGGRRRDTEDDVKMTIPDRKGAREVRYRGGYGEKGLLLSGEEEKRTDFPFEERSDFIAPFHSICSKAMAFSACEGIPFAEELFTRSSPL